MGKSKKRPKHTAATMPMLYAKTTILGILLLMYPGHEGSHAKY